MAGSKLPLAPDDVRGRQMGDYEVLCRLSTGGMAEILLATRRGLAGFHKPVVLKKILPDIHDQEEFVQMFLDEARVTAAFNHPNIAQVFDLDVAGDELFLAMEFVPGATLIEVARACRTAQEPMPPGFSLAAVRDTALALHYAHTFTDALGQPSPVIHRDVAEKNIMVTYEGVTKLLDFGIAKHLAGASRTQVGMVKGTSGYMSPEQLLGEPLDARSDLFSLGVVLHECLTGMRLFPGKSPVAVTNAVLKGPIPEPSRTNKAVPPELDALVLKALARKREDRFATTLEFAREMERTVGPLIWLPEKSGELLRRLFAERREQTRQLLAGGRAQTGEVKLAQPFSDKDSPATPPPAPAATPSSPGMAVPRTPPGGQSASPGRPSMSRLPAVPAPPAASSEQTDIVSYSVVTRPPAAQTPGPATPPPPPEETNVQRPAQTPARARPPRMSAEPATVLNPPALEPLREPPLREPPRAPARPPPPPEPAPPRARSLSRADALASVSSKEAEQEPELKTAIIRPQRVTGEQPVTSDATVPRYNPARAARRPSLPQVEAVNPPAREPEDDAPEYPTAPSLTLSSSGNEDEDEFEDEFTRPDRPAPALLSPLPADNEFEDELTRPDRPAPALRPSLPADNELEDELTRLNRPAPVLRSSPPADPDDEIPTATIPPDPARRGVLWAVLFLLLLMGGAAALVVLRLDGGSAPAAPKDGLPLAQPIRAQPQQTQAQPAPAQPEVQPAEAEAPPAQPEAPSAPAQQAPAPETSVPAPAPKDDEPGTMAQAETPEPSRPTKRVKATAGSRRKQQREDPAADVAPSPELVTNPDEADRAWQALERERAGTAEPSGGTGSLTLATDRYAKVYLGSRLLGETPLFRVPLPVGKHTLRLAADGKSLKLQVEIKADEVTSLRVPLAKPAGG